MSYERQNSTRLEQYRARQAERIDAMNRAIDAGQTTVVASSSENAEPARTTTSAIKTIIENSTPKFRRRIVPRKFGMFTGLITDGRGRKSATATGVAYAFRPHMNVKAAALISPNEPRDGQLFTYDASTGQMVPVNESDVAQKVRVVTTRGFCRKKRRVLVTAKNK